MRDYSRLIVTGTSSRACKYICNYIMKTMHYLRESILTNLSNSINSTATFNSLLSLLVCSTLS